MGFYQDMVAERNASKNLGMKTVSTTNKENEKQNRLQNREDALQIHSLKQQLNEVQSQLQNRKIDYNSMYKKKEGKKSVQNTKDLVKERESIIKKLRKYGVIVKPDSLNQSSLKYFKREGGLIDMLNKNDITRMKIDVYEESAQGKISDNMKEYLLTYLENVGTRVSAIDTYNEAVANLQASKMQDVHDFLESGHRSGILSDDQYEIMCEFANDAELYSLPTPDNMTNMVMKYLEAAENGDADAKEEISEDINTAKELKDKKADADEALTDLAGETENGEVTEAVETINEKLNSLKIKLTDEEKKLVDALDNKIKKQAKECKNGESCNDDPKEDETPATEEQKENEEPVKEEPVKESASQNPTKGGFESIKITPSFDMSDIESYMRESVYDGSITEEEAALIAKSINALK